MTRKWKVVSSSEFDHDVEKDVSNIVPSTSRKSAGKKVLHTIVAALKDTCALLDERKAQLELVILSLKGNNAGADEQMESEKEEETNDTENENKDGDKDSDSSSEAAD